MLRRLLPLLFVILFLCACESGSSSSASAGSSDTAEDTSDASDSGSGGSGDSGDGDSGDEVSGDSGDTSSDTDAGTDGGSAEDSLPPDPKTIAPEIPSGGEGFMDQVDFLFNADTPVQKDLNPESLDEDRVAVVRGRVLDRNNDPLPGVSVRIHGQPQLGTTRSRADGGFDLVVNGGGRLIVHYEKDGYLPVQRAVEPQWNDFDFAEDIVMIPLDPEVTSIELGNGQPIQVAQGSTQTDSEGTRQATLLFPKDTQASMTLPDGSTQALSTLNVRATEYTVGDNGHEAMPGELPPTSAYTYAVELSVDEAIAAGASRVDFDQPVALHVDNFLDFPTGEIVPAGYYDYEDAAWKAGDNGRVIEILAIEAELAVLDLTGDGQAATAEELTDLGVNGDELRTLADLYEPGKTLWRTPVSHFTPWDCNWPYGPPMDAERPNVPTPETLNQHHPENTDEENECPGCVISPQRQTLGESLPVAGTPFELVYRSDRTPGYKNNVADITLSGDSVPASLNRIDLHVRIAGQSIRRSFSGVAHQSYRFEWDGRDGYGREMYGDHTAHIAIRYNYPCVYYAARSDFLNAWAQVGNVGRAIGTRGNCRSTVLSQSYQVQLTAPQIVRANTVDAWSLNVHNAYDTVGGVLYLGDGSRISELNSVIETVAGTGISGFSGDGGLATDAQLGAPSGVAFDSKGKLLIADAGSHSIRRVSKEGVIETIAGTGNPGFSGDGGLANEAQLRSPSHVQADYEGNIYIADAGNHRVRRVSTDGTITTIAGTGEFRFQPESGPALETPISSPQGLALDDQGQVYIAETWSYLVRRITQDGIIQTVAGTGSYGLDSGELQATDATLWFPWGVTIGNEGELYIADTWNHSVRKVRSDGMIETIAGTGVGDFSGDGRSALNSTLTFPKSVAVNSIGDIYIADGRNNRIRKISTDGIIDTVAGDGAFAYSGDNGPPIMAQLAAPWGLAIDASDNLYIADVNNYRIRKISFAGSPIAFGKKFQLLSQDGTLVFEFNTEGYHGKTINSNTGITKYKFEYTDDGQLIAIGDQHDNITRIERDGDGHATAIIAPQGQRTDLTLDHNGHLTGLSNPNGERWSMDYTEDGLLTRFETPNGHANRFHYDSDGRLIEDEAPNGGGWTIERTDLENGYRTDMTSGEGLTSRFTVQRSGTDERTYINESPDGSLTNRTHTDGSTRITRPDGTQITRNYTPDPRFGMQTPVTSYQRIETPSGLALEQTTERSVELDDVDDQLSHSILTEQVRVHDREQTALYSATDRTWTHTSPEGRIRTQWLDDNGLLDRAQVGNLTDIRYHYDDRGRPTRIDRGARGERPVEFGYDHHGYLSSLTDAQGRTVLLQNDAIGRVLQQTQPNGGVVHYDYDANGNLTEIRLPTGERHQFVYDAVDQRERYTPPPANDNVTDDPLGTDHPTTRYQFNRDKQLRTVTRPDGNELDYRHDDTTGQLTELAIPAGTYAFTYYGADDDIHSGQLKTLTAPGGQQIDYEYDGFLPTGTTWSGPVSGTLGHEYNDFFEPVTQTLNGDSLSLSFNRDSQITQAGDLSLQYQNDTGLLAGTELEALSTENTFNDLGELTAQTARHQGSSLYQYSLQRDHVGRISGKAETTDDTTTDYQYDYDQNDRLVEVRRNSEIIQSWQYDANGNRTHENGVRIAEYDAQDRLISYGDNDYRYTANGELTRKTNTETGDVTHYDYDAFSNLRNVTLADGTEIDYIIDGQNRRVGKKRNGTLEQGFLYQGQLNPVAELDGDNNIVARFVYADKGHVPSYMIKGGTQYRLITDHLGSVRMVVNASTGDIAQRMDYDAWGSVTTDTNPGFQPFGYAGGLYDRDTGLVRFGARDYDPQVGRWTTKDPIGFGGGLNHYAYTDNNPINFIDPLGLRWETVDIDYHGAKNWFIAIANRLGSLDEGTIWNFYSCVGCTRDVIQEWVPQTSDMSCDAGDPLPREQRKIRQVYGEFPDEWHVDGKSWHWTPPVPTQTYRDVDTFIKRVY